MTPPAIPPIFAVSNHKGGPGKTSVVLALADAAGSAGRRVLVIDMDPQANATYGLGLDAAATAQLPTTFDLLQDGQPAGIARSAIVDSGALWSDNVKLIPSDLSLGSEEGDSAIGMEFRLRTTLAGALDDFDIVLIDCGPSLGKLTANAFIAASHVVFVTNLDAAGIRGLWGAYGLVERIVEARMNPDLQLAGVVVNRVENTSEQNFRRDELAKELPPGLLLDPSIPKRAVVPEAYGARAPLTAYNGRARDVTEPARALLTQLEEIPGRA